MIKAENHSRPRWYLILGIIFITYNVLAFAIPFRRGAVFWIAYLFTAGAILSQAVIYEIAFSKADSIRRVFLGIPIAKLGYTHLTMQLAIFAILVTRATFVPIMPVWFVIVPSVILAAAIAIAVIFADAVRVGIDRLETRQVADTMFISELRADLTALLPRITDDGLRKKVEKLSEATRYSDPVSNEGLVGLETEIRQKFASLKQAVADGDEEEKKVEAKAATIVDEISLLLVERNEKCKVLKRSTEHPIKN